MGQPKSILLVDDHNLFREGLKMIIRRDSGFTVVAEAKNAEEGLLAAFRVKPDIALLDISLPGRSGIDLAREIHAKLPGVRIIMVSDLLPARARRRSRRGRRVRVREQGVVTRDPAPRHSHGGGRPVLPGRRGIPGAGRPPGRQGSPRPTGKPTASTGSSPPASRRCCE